MIGIETFALAAEGGSLVAVGFERGDAAREESLPELHGVSQTGETATAGVALIDAIMCTMTSSRVATEGLPRSREADTLVKSLYRTEATGRSDAS